jgi:DNA polymerase IV
MRPVAGLRYLFLDLNSYFASVEQQVRPELRSKPVAVVPIANTDATCAIAASYEAKALGVKTGTRIYEAKKLCPDLICVDARHDLYVEYHHRIMDEVNNHLPIEKVRSIDEASCRLIGDECEPERARELARSIKTGIRAKVGDMLRCSVGVAPTVLLAKIASKLQKPDGLTLLPTEILPGPLLKLKLIDLPGIGWNMEQHLMRAGVCSIADLWALSPKHARTIWGSVGGERFWYALHGYELPEGETRRGSIGHSRMLSPKMRPSDQARIVARALLLKAAMRLRRYGDAAGALGFSARGESHTRFVNDTNFPPTQDSFVLLMQLEKLWGQMMRQNRHREPLKKVSVWLHHLVPVDRRMPDLFIPRRADGFTRGEALWTALDKLVARYGRGAVAPASQFGVTLQYLGAKIAFARVPDRVEFNE